MAHPSRKDLESLTFNDMTENATTNLSATIHSLTIKR